MCVLFLNKYYAHDFKMNICTANCLITYTCVCVLLCIYLCSDVDNSGFVSDFELQELFREASFSIPGYKVREIVEIFIAGDTNKDEKISFEEFVSVSLNAVCEQRN